ncbi:Protein of unknown function DUF3716 [Penicillium angulare]|uniref:Uncharacterized protein n=1 Tax=Penicillium angulare TaxID=116970 RepID=A0A9W9KSE7_9EURO|nr:Protein of unknown function DUF3716 [Penicillium angulare]
MSAEPTPDDIPRQPTASPQCIILALPVGPVTTEPGRWARLIMLFGWACAKTNSGYLKGDILPTLQYFPPLREPCLRVTEGLNGLQFDRQIGESLRHVEAVTAQITGAEASTFCTQCQKGHAKFTQCIIFMFAGSQACANCHWRGRTKECSFYNATGETASPAALQTPSYESYPRGFGQPLSRRLTDHIARDEWASKVKHEIQSLKAEFRVVKSSQATVASSAATTKGTLNNAKIVEESKTISRFLDAAVTATNITISANEDEKKKLLDIERRMMTLLEDLERVLRL